MKNISVKCMQKYRPAKYIWNTCEFERTCFINSKSRNYYFENVRAFLNNGNHKIALPLKAIFLSITSTELFR